MTLMSSLAVIRSFPPYKMTLSGLLESRCSAQRDQDFLFFETIRKHTWLEFYEWTATLSAKLALKKLKRGDRVLIAAPNSDLLLALNFALADMGATFVPVNPELREEDYLYLLKKTEPKIVFVAENLVRMFSELQKTSKLAFAIASLADPDLALRQPGARLQHLGDEDDTALILFTSGTTGFPKGAMHSQKNAVVAGEAFVERMLLHPADRLLCILPFFHINALFYSIMGAVAAGASLIVTEKFSASKFWNLAADLQATEVNIIAAIGKILAQRDRREFRADHRLRKVYGAPVSREIEKLFREEFLIPTVIEGYGMTEIPGAINNRIGVQVKVGTMGVAALHADHSRPFTQLKIVDDEEREVGEGAEGELLVKTPILMQGYYRDAEQTQSSFTADGWFKTGDLVKKDADGFYVFVARKKDIIRKRGENISGAEIDRVVEQCPGVKEAATIGVPSDMGEEELLVAYVPHPDLKISDRDVYDWCLSKLAKVKVPRFYIQMDALPHTPTARVAKHKVKTSLDLSRASDFAPMPGKTEK